MEYLLDLRTGKVSSMEHVKRVIVVEQTEDIMLIMCEGMYNYVNQSGKIISDEWFKKASTFCDGFGRVQREDGLYYYIRKDGTYLNDKGYIEARDFHDEMACVCFSDGTNRLWNYVKTDGNLLVDNELFLEVRDFKEGITRAKKKDKLWYYIDKNGKQLNSVGYFQAFDFNEEFAVVQPNINGKYYYLKSNGCLMNWSFVHAWSFYEGFAKVLVGEKYNYLKKNGELLSKEQFRDVKEFHNGFGRVQRKDGLYYYIKPDSTYLNQKGFLYANSFSEGFASVCESTYDKNSIKYWYGRYIDKNGEFINDEKFLEFYDFKEGFARVKRIHDRLFYYLKEDGTYLNDEGFVNARSFSEGFACVELKEKGWFYMRKDKTFLNKYGFYDAHSFNKGKAIAQIGDVEVTINTNGDIAF